MHDIIAKYIKLAASNTDRFELFNSNTALRWLVAFPASRVAENIIH